MTEQPPHPFAPKFEFAFTVGITLTWQRRSPRLAGS